MTEHYYTKAPESGHKIRTVTAHALGRTLAFETDAGVFSRDGLDPGSRLLIESAPPLRGRVLDLGCGWGPVGTFLALENPEAHFVLTDINERAVALAEKNLRAHRVDNAKVVSGDGFSAVEGLFDAIFLNPPIRAGKQVIYAMFDEAYAHLTEGGALYIVIRKQQGAPSALKHMAARYEEAVVIERGGGYWIIRGRKGEKHEATED